MIDNLMLILTNDNSILSHNIHDDNFTYRYIKTKLYFNKDDKKDNQEDKDFDTHVERIKLELLNLMKTDVDNYLALDDKFFEQFTNYLVQFYKAYYDFAIDLQYKLILNYHKFIQNQYTDFKILETLLS
jgi:hypothetical protein